MQLSYIRLKEMIESTGTIGFALGRGTTRLAYTPAYEQMIEKLSNRIKDAGLPVKVDTVGNLYSWLDGEENSIVIGSHLDTVPNGGILDGAYGVLAGIECLITLKENGYIPRHRIEVVGFTEEEGNVIGGTFGSRCMAGLPQEQSVWDALPSVGLSTDAVKNAKRNPADLFCYLELHIEQGGLLEAEQKTIGIVNGIAGIRRYKLSVNGQGNHAGTTPMHLRDDALVKAADIISTFDRIIRKYGNSLVGTVGSINNESNVVNVIPSKTELFIELRSIDPAILDSAVRDLQEYTKGMAVVYSQFLDEQAAIMDQRICATIEHVCADRGYGYIYMSSGAGHDAISMSHITPSGMIFIPSTGGISHSIQEHSEWADMEKGVEVLLDTLIRIDRNGL